MADKRGIILLNLGGPLTLADVKPFLYNLFSDPDILVGVPAPFRQALAFGIAQIKGRSSIEMYRQIGGGSPQLKWAEAQARQVEARLAAGGGNAEWKVVVGFRASAPTIEHALSELRSWGATTVVALPLFPQYSTTTTGSCFKEIRRVCRKWGWAPKLAWVESWCDDADYVALQREAIDRAVAEAVGAAGESAHVLFSAHSLPLKIVERGDPYPQHVDRTVQALVRGLRQPWSLAFQSRNGRLPWLDPYVEDELERLAKSGVRRIVAVPISFVSDHIETLYELDVLYAEHARRHGITSWSRTRSFNDEPRLSAILERLARDETERAR